MNADVTKPWSNTQLRKLGEAIRDGSEKAQSELPAPLRALGADPTLLPGLRQALNADLNPRDTVRALEAELQSGLQKIRYAVAQLSEA